MLSNVKTTPITTLSQQLQSILSKNPREIRHFLPVEFLQQPTVLHTVPIWENQDYDFFALWLDPRLSCNAGFFKDDSHSLLFQSQKINHMKILRCLSHFLVNNILITDCQWGSFMLERMKSGFDTTAIYKNYNHKKYCEEHLKKQPPKVNYLLTNNKVENLCFTYDAIVDIETLNSTHIDLWAQKLEQYLSKLKKGGIIFMQTLVRTHKDFTPYFTPKNQTPSLAEIQKITKSLGVKIQVLENLSLHYIKTTAAWIKNFDEQISNISNSSTYANLWGAHIALLHAKLTCNREQLVQIVLQK